MKKVEFQVRFDGTTEGLPTHRLSMAAFKTTLSNLIEAIQMSAELASRGVSEGLKTVRIGPVGRSVDLQLASVTDGCVTLNYLVTVTPDTLDPGADDLPERTVQTFIGDLRAAGGPEGTRNRAASRYLNSLPAGVTSQDYRASADGVELAALRIVGSRHLPPVIVSPRLRTVTATILGTVFRPKHERVTLTLDGVKKLTCRATPAVVEQALALRGDKVTATVLFAPDAKGPDHVDLVTLRPAAEPLTAPGVAERDAYLFAKWAGALARLAE